MKPEILKFDFKQQMSSPETLDLYIYSDVAPDGYNFWTGEKIESETSQRFFREKLNEFADIKNINLYINSFGGSVIEGYGIYSQLKRHPAQKTVYIDGYANSVASVIAMCGDKIVMGIQSMMGIHNMMNFCFGNASEHRKCADDLDRMMEGNRQLYLSRSKGKLTLEKLTELLDAETYLTAQECLEYGFCDEIAEFDSGKEAAIQLMQRLNDNMASQVKYFQSLKQSFADAMEALKTTNINTPPRACDPEQKTENRLKLFAAFYREEGVKNDKS